jgi:hypothetical protein
MTKSSSFSKLSNSIRTISSEFSFLCLTKNIPPATMKTKKANRAKEPNTDPKTMRVTGVSSSEVTLVEVGIRPDISYSIVEPVE